MLKSKIAYVVFCSILNVNVRIDVQNFSFTYVKKK